MTERTQLILYICIATLVVVLFIAALLVRRHGHTLETKRILNAIEGARGQIDVLEGTVKPELGYLRSTLNNFMERFGFLRGPRP